jgi:hypothetical protein
MMNPLPGLSPRPEEPRSFDFFFDRLDACLRKGRGFSLFQADAGCVVDFSEQCQRRGLAPLSIRLSSIQDASMDLGASSPPFVILIQDLSYRDFLDRASVIADRLVFPLWFRRIPVCLFSALGGEAYKPPPLKGDDLHTNFAGVVRALLAEQTLTLLERSNYQLASPELLVPGAGGQAVLFTPLEEKLRAALEADGLTYQAGVRLPGR